MKEKERDRKDGSHGRTILEEKEIRKEKWSEYRTIAEKEKDSELSDR